LHGLQRGEEGVRALVVDDSAEGSSGLAEWLEGHGFTGTSVAASVAEAQQILERRAFDLVLLDLDLPDGNGLTLLEALDESPDSEVVIITGHGSIDSAVEAMRGGVIDYLTKPVDLKRLQRIVGKLRQTMELRQEVRSLRQELRELGRFGPMIGSSPAMQQVYDLISRVAPTSTTVMVTGETGTGKELVAQTIHQLSRRAAGPFLPINCGAVAPSLIESELFGHERGSFTGADRLRKGIFERAAGGTLFLDEITEMPLESQVKLLRVLETNTVSRLGGDEVIAVDVRVVAASNRDIRSAVKEGKLREDLQYRLNVFPIQLPPLRERGDDIELIAHYQLDRLNNESDQHKQLTPGASRRLRSRSWPGNIRELKNVIERAFIVAGEEIDEKAILVNEPADVEEMVPEGQVRIGIGSTIAEAERRLILATLARLDGDKKRTARTLGISLKTLYNRLNVYGSGSRSEAGPGNRESA
jgi:two-component system response regulator AtoC